MLFQHLVITGVDIIYIVPTPYEKYYLFHGVACATVCYDVARSSNISVKLDMSKNFKQKFYYKILTRNVFYSMCIV